MSSTSQSDVFPRDVILKLLAFTFAMIVIPIGSFFATVHTIFKGTRHHPDLRYWSLTTAAGNSTYAGALAAIMANVVLISYVIVAMKEDESEKDQSIKQNEGKKDR